MSSLVGQTVSHYQIFERIGSGGMGVVYKARDVRLDRIVALKFLPPEVTRDPEAKRRFVKEAKTASSLQHANICVIHDIEEANNGQLFISMEYYEGETLDRTILRGPLPLQDALDVAIQTAEALARAHETGIVHRDIKPGNIMLTSRAEVKILDFGLAKLSSTGDPIEAGTTSGTVTYMSPEQARGKATDHRSDLWSLGAVLYEMMTGQPPFSGEFQNAIVHLILHSEPQPLGSPPADIPVEVQQIVQKALAKDVSQRYQSADEMLTDLRSVRTSGESGTPGPDEQPTSPSTSRRRRALVIGLATLIPTAALVLWLLGNLGGGNADQIREPSIAVLPFSSITPSEEDRIFTEGIHDDILSHLAKIRGLRVLGRQSARRYRDSDLRPAEIGSQLGVGYLLEGSVRRVADSIRIVAQLLRAETGEHIWAETYDREYAAVFSIQTDVAQRVAHAIHARLTPEEQDRIRHIPTQNLEAYEYYLRGKHYTNNYWTFDTHRLSAAMYREALSLDSTFALASARLSLAYSELYTMRMERLPQNHLDSARIFLEKARSINPTLAEVHLANGLFLIIESLDLDGALELYEKALAIEPGNSETYERIGHVHFFQRNFEKADAFYERAYELDPQGRRAIGSLAYSHFVQRRWEDADMLYSKSTALFPESEQAYAWRSAIRLSGHGNIEGARRILEEGIRHVPKPARWSITQRLKVEIYARNYARALALLGDETDRDLSRAMTHRYMGNEEEATLSFDAARATAEDRIRKWPNTTPDYWYLGYAYAGLGRKTEAISNARYRVDTPAHDIYWRELSLQHLARILVMVGEHEQAMDELEHLLSVPSRLNVWDLRLDPVFDPLRDHPRFKRLVADDHEQSLN